MRSSLSRIVTLALALCFCWTSLCVAAAQGERRTRKRPRQKRERRVRLPKSYAEFAKEVGLTVQQQQKLAQALKAKAEVVKKWRSNPEKGGKLARLSKQLRSPEVKKDRAKARRIRDQMRALDQERRKLQAQCDAKVLSVLTPQQREKWQVCVLYQRSTRALARRVKLTPGQQGKARKLCGEAAKKLKPLQKPNLSKEEARQKAQILRKLRQDILALLTPQQKAQLKKKPQPKAQKGKRRQRPAKRRAKKKES